MRWPRRTARLRMTALYSSIFLLSGAALVAITYGLFERATDYKNPHLPTIPSTPAIKDLTLLPSPAKALFQLGQIQKQLTQDQQQLTLPQGPIAHVQQELTQDQQHLAQAQHQLTLAVHQVAQAGAVQAAQRASDSHQLLEISGIALAIVALLALLVGWLVAGRMLRPLRTITRTAQRISSTSLHERLALDGPRDELKELGDTLDDLFGRLDAAFEAQRHFVANASHELRTPLTAERNLLQVALDNPDTSAASWRCTAEELLASNDEQTILIEALLALASSESGFERRERLDLAEILETVVSRPGLATASLSIHVEIASRPVPLDGDPKLVERLLANLVDNAIQHNISGGHVRISAGSVSGRAALTVTNTGPVISSDQIERLFRPFQRLDPRRTHHKNGHGLGLSIVRAIATSHNAGINAESMPGGGLSVTVTFPSPTDSQSAHLDVQSVG